MDRRFAPGPAVRGADRDARGRRGLRIAWLGPAPDEDGSVPYVATLLLAGLADHGAELECFVTTKAARLPERLTEHAHIEFITHRQRWSWGRWYSGDRAGVLAQLSEQATRAWAQRSLVAEMARRHRAHPFDLIYLFSQWELPSHAVPDGLPIVVHPQVHAAGEQRWHARESWLARQTEPRAQTLAVSQVLRARAYVQRRVAGRASMIIAASAQFRRQLADDYGIDAKRLHVVPNPVDTDRFRPSSTPRARGAALTLLYVSRFSVRKGLELVVELSHRLNDLAGQVRILVVGYPSPWSNYSRLLDGLNPAVGRTHGLAHPSTMDEIYRTGDALIQPSHYEPFGLSVAEALASGLPVVVSRCVGAAAGVDERCCLTFETGSIDGLEHAVRVLVKQLGEDGAACLHARARAEAERLFAPTRVAAELYAALEQVRAPLQGGSTTA